MSKAKNVKQVLVAARWLIANKGWCQKYYAMTPTGVGVPWNHPNASCFCAEGAVCAVQVIDPNLTLAALERLEETMGFNAIAFNDSLGTTKRKVIAKFDKTIASL